MSDILPTVYDFDVQQPVSTDVAIYGGIFAKRHVLPVAGTYVPQHAHAYDHLSVITAGGMRAWCDGALLGDFYAPHELRIGAHTKHVFMSLADATSFYCLHSVDAFEESEQHELPKAATLRDVGKPKPDGILIKRESLDTILSSPPELFEAHCLSVGDAPDAWLDKNWALMKRLEVTGGLYMFAARRGGDLLGYLMTIVSPALDEIGKSEALHTLFYSSPDVPGLGLRLQRTSIEYAKSIGVDTMVLRAGHRGQGPRLAALYRRLGAVPSGNLFMIDLQSGAL